MITYLPEIYPDELVYSWFCRYYVHAGCLTHRMALEDILHNRSCHPSKEFLGHLNSEMEKKIQEIYSLDHLIKSHTLYPQYARFVPLTIKEKALQALAYESCDPHHVLPILPRGEEDQFLKYCPVCVREDRGRYGETYWHRSHQLRQVQVCHKHHCKLENSTVTAKSEKTYTLCPAEEYSVRGEARINHDSLSQEFAEYVTNVFHAPMDVERDIPISVVLYGIIGSHGIMAIISRQLIVVKRKHRNSEWSLTPVARLGSDSLSFLESLFLLPDFLWKYRMPDRSD